MIIHLNAAELLLCVHAAGVRQGAKEANNILHHSKAADTPPFELHFLGLIGETAVAKAIGSSVRYDITLLGDGGIDMMFRGHTIQVKTRDQRRDDQMFYFNDLSEFSAEWFIPCVLLSPASIDVVGFISRRKFETKMFTHNFGYGDRVCVRADALTPIEDIDKAIKEKP